MQTATAAGPWAELTRPEAFPDDPSAAAGVEWIQTHLSHVYRTAERVYKFRKPVDLGFVCFTSRAERNADCLREVALNRRLAPDVYLGVAPLLRDVSGVRLGACAETLSGPADEVEHCVVMRCLPEGRDALSLLRAGALSADQIDALAVRIAEFHAHQGLGRPAPFAADAWLERCTGPAEQNLRSLAEAGGRVVPRELLEAARAGLQGFVAEHTARFERRRRDGRAVDAHGDLHLDHVWYETERAAPIAIDCLEFSESLRHIDSASEVAFPAMDLRYRGAPRLAEHFLRSYARESDDFDLYALVDYYIAYRAGVRAKVASLAAGDGAIEPAQRARATESAHRHLALAVESLEARPAPVLLLVGGSVGSGKSTLAKVLAEALDAVTIASDRVRKRLLGATPTQRLGAGWRQGAYSEEQTRRTYAALLERARPVLASGRVVVLDATWSKRAQRAEALGLARELGCAPFFLEATCAQEVARVRLERRAASGGDPSDAGPELLDRSLAGFESLDDWPATERVEFSTDRPDWREAVPALASRIAARRGSVA